MQSIVFLYNDRDRQTVEAISRVLQPSWRSAGTNIWMASQHLDAFGDIFEQIEGEIEAASGVVFFLGSQGLGRFQQNIELGAVNTELWQRGAAFGRLLVHLGPGVKVPRTMLRWPSVNHDGSLTGLVELAAGISERFRIAGNIAD